MMSRLQLGLHCELTSGDPDQSPERLVTRGKESDSRDDLEERVSKELVESGVEGGSDSRHQ